VAGGSRVPASIVSSTPAWDVSGDLVEQQDKQQQPSEFYVTSVLILLSLKPAYERGQAHTGEAYLCTSQDQSGLSLLPTCLAFSSWLPCGPWRLLTQILGARPASRRERVSAPHHCFLFFLFFRESLAPASLSFSSSQQTSWKDWRRPVSLLVFFQSQSYLCLLMSAIIFGHGALRISFHVLF